MTDIERIVRDEITRRRLLKGAVAGGLAIGGGGILASCSGGSSGGGGTTTAADTTGAAGSISPGGTFRVALTGGSAKDTLDIHNSVTDVDNGRTMQLFETLALRDPDYEMEMILAESIEQASDKTISEWVVRLKPDITFHDGKPLTADDVIYTLRRILDPKNPGGYATAIDYIDTNRLKKMDPLTVKIFLKTPNANFLDDISQFANGIVPEGFDPKNPVGTGPYKFKSFTPGQESIFVKNENYWRENEPNFDEVVIVSLEDDGARVNALISGQVDAISNVPAAQFDLLEANPDVQTVVSENGNYQPITMRVDVAPFDDVRVRQAFKMIVNREQMVEQALNGQGRPANDMPGPFDPMYNSDIPQRTQDIEQAKALLKEAGHENLTVELVTAPVFGNIVEQAQVFAQQAKEAGVTVNVKRVTNDVFFGDEYLQRPLSQHYWYTRSILSQVSYQFLPTSSWNETHWNNKEFIANIKKGQTSADPAVREQAMHEAQRIMWEDSGVIIHTFTNQIDAVKSDIVGMGPSRTGISLMNFNFRSIGRSA